MLRLPRRSWPVMWLYMHCDVWMFMAQLWQDCCLMLHNSKVSDVQPCKVARNCVQKLCLFQCPLQQHISANPDFAHLFFFVWKTIMNPSDNLLVALSSCVPKVWADNFRETETKNSRGLFLMNSNVWKLNNTTECVRLHCQYVLQVIIWK